MTFDLLICNIFVPQKVPLSKISDDVIARDLWFGPPIKNPGYAYIFVPGSPASSSQTYSRYKRSDAKTSIT